MTSWRETGVEVGVGVIEGVRDTTCEEVIAVARVPVCVAVAEGTGEERGVRDNVGGDVICKVAVGEDSNVGVNPGVWVRAWVSVAVADASEVGLSSGGLYAEINRETDKSSPVKRSR